MILLVLMVTCCLLLATSVCLAPVTVTCHLLPVTCHVPLGSLLQSCALRGASGREKLLTLEFSEFLSVNKNFRSAVSAAAILDLG